MQSGPSPFKRLKRHLLATPLDGLMSVLLLALLGWIATTTLHWLFVDADWQVVSQNLPLYAFGSYPPQQRWRPFLWIALLIGLTLSLIHI